MANRKKCYVNIKNNLSFEANIIGFLFFQPISCCFVSIFSLFFTFFIYFYLYIYPPDSQESNGGAIHRLSNYHNLLPEMPRYCCPLVI